MDFSLNNFIKSALNPIVKEAANANKERFISIGIGKSAIAVSKIVATFKLI